MFAYCNNNPASFCDPCGTCIHRWDFWNDCKACGGATLGKKIGSNAKRIYDFYVLQKETQNELTKQQTQIIKNSGKQSLERNAYRIQTQIDSQYQRDMCIRNSVTQTFSDVDWQRVGRETLKQGVLGAIGGAATGATAAALGAPFTGGMSIPASAFLTGVTGLVGGTVSGFVGVLWDELD